METEHRISAARREPADESSAATQEGGGHAP